MVAHGCHSWFLVLAAISFSLPARSAISTSTPTPPLQWLNITQLLSGPSAPPLKGASIGYDETTRSLLVFGGESESGFPTSSTYLLNLDSLIWTVPTPPTGLTDAPPPRSGAISGFDWAANQRQCHLVIGGRGSDGSGLTDVWEYDFLDQFWAPVSLSPGGPSGRWGAAGGNDNRVVYLPTPGLNNSFFLAGGQDQKTISPLSDVWRLNISGTLSPNNPRQVFGSWESLSIPTLPSLQGSAGTVISQQIISGGGCRATSPANTDNACAVGDSFVINTASGNSINPASCPAPRYEGVMVPNMNGASSSFSSQVFLLLGTFNSSYWNDSGGLSKGEVAILDTGTGSWARILPAGDPNSASPYPSPRSGAAAITYNKALIGQSRAAASDTIVFGGRDANGKYLSEVWLLRAYNGVITKSGDQSWGGYGNGQLQSGSNAGGAGVTNMYIDTCATQVSPDVPPPTSTNIPTPTSTSGGNTTITHTYNVSIIHKILAPLSVALVLPVLLIYRLSSPSLKTPAEPFHNHLSVPTLLISCSLILGLGIAGLVTSFTSISQDSSLVKRKQSSLYLRTGHGIAGVALAAAFYIVVLAGFLYLLFTRYRPDRGGPLSQDEAEKLARSPAPSTTVLDGPTDHHPSGNHSRSQSSTGLLQLWKPSIDQSTSPDADGDEFGVRVPPSPSPRPSRRFEVVNRPKNAQRASSHSMSGLLDHSPPRAAAHIQMRLGDMSWLSRRRMVNTVGDLDFALTQIPRTPEPRTSTPADGIFNRGSTSSAHDYPLPLVKYPSSLEVAFRALFHTLLLALCILSLAQLLQRGPIVAFVVFLVWTVSFYVAIIAFAWRGRPRDSILTVTFSRLRPHPHPSQSGSRPMSSTTPEPSIPFTPDLRGPYIHSPAFRTAQEDESYLSAGRNHEDGDDGPDGDEDEETRQRRIEDEMSRRDVSIVTVPKRKLWIANPS